MINHPLEKMIKKYYIHKAKQILKHHKQLQVIGVTGSYGKTSVKNIVNGCMFEGASI